MRVKVLPISFAMQEMRTVGMSFLSRYFCNSPFVGIGGVGKSIQP